MSSQFSDLPPVTGNLFNKYESNNPIVRFLIRNYKNALKELIEDLPIQSALDVGSGEGYILSYIQTIRPDLNLVALDISYGMVLKGYQKVSSANWVVAYSEKLPFRYSSFDLILAFEVMEHVQKPERVLEEFQKLGGKFCIFSVPKEPIWRILNVLRMKYLKNWGNTPGHIHHWSRKDFTHLIGQYFTIRQVRNSFPWTFILVEFIC